MRIALCLYGYFNNREDENAGMKGYEYIKNTILKHGNVDVFVHSWDLKNRDLILDLYNPKHEEFEFQTNFVPVLKKNYGVDQELIDQGFDRNSTIYHQCTLQSSFSFFTSRSNSILLKMEVEQEEKFTYDVAIVARYDLGHRSRMHMGYNVSEMNFDPNADMNYIYSAMWQQLNAGYADQWFYSSSENINILRHFGTYGVVDFKVGSDYNKALNNGWFDSNTSNEFSNERMKPVEQRSKNLMKYPTWQMINNHLYHKWFFQKVGLYEVSKFV